MPRRVVIHAGFHKTGTSTVQQVLRRNRPLLKPYLRSVLKGQMQDLLHAARGYSTWRDPLTLEKFARRFDAILASARNMPRRVLCLSAEELSGHLPGRPDLSDYSAAPVLATEMARVTTAAFPRAEVAFLYTTREPGDWLRSAYWEHVKSSSLTMGWEQFAHRFAGSADLGAIADAVARAQPYPVHSVPLEHSAGGTSGPAGPLLDLCGVPAEAQTGLEFPEPVNERRDEAVLLALLAANRDYTDPEARRSAKQAILRAAQENAGD